MDPPMNKCMIDTHLLRVSQTMTLWGIDGKMSQAADFEGGSNSSDQAKQNSSDQAIWAQIAIFQLNNSC